MNNASQPAEIIEFWFETLAPRDWFQKSETLDRTIGQRFGDTLAAAARCELETWREHDHGRLAEIIVLDQFARNVFRDTDQAFANDALALALAQEAVARGVDRNLSNAQRAFLYMPYMHSESLLIHEQALRLFAQPGLEKNHEFERRHYDILCRFGRYPHRNALLGRTNTVEEDAFLEEKGSHF